MLRSLLGYALALAAGVDACLAQTDQQVYAGKQITLTINFAAGGPPIWRLGSSNAAQASIW